MTRKLLIAAVMALGLTGAGMAYFKSNEPTWTPDGQWIAFECGRAANYEYDDIYRVRPDGSITDRLTDNHRHNISPAWSPDGAWILFVSYHPTDHTDEKLYQMRPDGSEAAPLIDREFEVREPAWSPDSQWIALIHEGDIYTMRPSGHDAARVTFYGKSAYGTPQVRNLAWSPDGAWLAYERYMDGRSDIYRIHPDGTGEQKLTIRGDDNRSPSWSPDSQWIVFASSGNIYRMTADGRELTTLVQGTADLSVSSASYSPDGQWIVYTGHASGRFSQIYKIRLDGSENTKLTDVDCYAFQPVWSPPFMAH